LAQNWLDYECHSRWEWPDGYVLEKKDPAVVANETKHTQNAVDKYLNDFRRVRSLYELNDNIDRIGLVTGIAKHVVNQYLEILKEVNKNDEN